MMSNSQDSNLVLMKTMIWNLVKFKKVIGKNHFVAPTMTKKAWENPSGLSKMMLNKSSCLGKSKVTKFNKSTLLSSWWSLIWVMTGGKQWTAENMI